MHQAAIAMQSTGQVLLRGSSCCPDWCHDGNGPSKMWKVLGAMHSMMVPMDGEFAAQLTTGLVEVVGMDLVAEVVLAVVAVI